MFDSLPVNLQIGKKIGSSAEFVGNLTHFQPTAVGSKERLDRGPRSEHIAP
jgi:hypothetical protein